MKLWVKLGSIYPITFEGAKKETKFGKFTLQKQYSQFLKQEKSVNSVLLSKIKSFQAQFLVSRNLKKCVPSYSHFLTLQYSHRVPGSVV